MNEDRRQIKDFTFMLIAKDLSRLSTCDRKHVGAVVIKDGRCVTWGYNGAPPGLPHCEENKHGWYGQSFPDWRELYKLEGRPNEADHQALSDWQDQQALNVCRNATHAEANALAFAARQGISTDGGTLYVTVSPCDVCARLLIAAGIVAVIYDEEYRDHSGLQLLYQAGVTCHAVS